jgi:hypothetical protein
MTSEHFFFPSQKLIYSIYLVNAKANMRGVANILIFFLLHQYIGTADLLAPM